MKFDYNELQEQRKKEILKDGHYVRIEIIVPAFSCNNDGSNIPYINLETLTEIDNITLSYLTRVLEDTSEVILKNYNLKDSRKVIDKILIKTFGFIPKD